MKEILITTLEEFHNCIMKYKNASGNILYRGHSNSEWELIPKAGRIKLLKFSDKDMFYHWRRRAPVYLNKDNLNDWDLLSIAQHTGLPTRLLDWTLNPLVAAFFAVIENPTVDGAIYVIRIKNKNTINTQEQVPFEMLANSVMYYQPSSTSQRLINQLGHFTIHNPPSLSVNKSSDLLIEKFLLAKEVKKELIFMLHQYGINYLSIYPDLEGLSKHLSWFAENIEYWNRPFEQ